MPNLEDRDPEIAEDPTSTETRDLEEYRIAGLCSLQDQLYYLLDDISGL